MSTEHTAEIFTERLRALATEERRIAAQRYFADADDIIGVRMGDVFALAKEHIDMPLDEVERLLRSPVHEARVGALSIMDKQARRKRTPESRREELYDLYLRNTDRIDNWDLVDVAAPHVVGGFLFDRARDPLYRLARSTDPWERRTALYATLFFVRNDDLADTYGIAEIVLDDPHPLVQKAVGTLLREAGRRDRERLLAFLEGHAAGMPRVALTYAMEHLDKDQRMHFRALTR